MDIKPHGVDSEDHEDRLVQQALSWHIVSACWLGHKNNTQTRGGGFLNAAVVFPPEGVEINFLLGRSTDAQKVRAISSEAFVRNNTTAEEPCRCRHARFSELTQRRILNFGYTEVQQTRPVLSRRAPVARSVTQILFGHFSLALGANSG